MRASERATEQETVAASDPRPARSADGRKCGPALALAPLVLVKESACLGLPSV